MTHHSKELALDNPDTHSSTEFGCPYCEAAYGDERLTLAHITRADDPLHANRNGRMPEEGVEVIVDKTIVDTRTRRPDEIDFEGVTLDDLPDELSAKRKYVVLAATRNPEETIRRRIHQQVQQLLEDDDSIEPPSESTVSRALDEFFHPHTNGRADTDGATETTPFAELEPLQQAIIIAELVNPDASHWSIADKVDCARSYPGQVVDRKADIVDQVKTRWKSGDTVEEILADELSLSDLAMLENSGRLADVDLQLPQEMNTATDTTSAENSNSPVEIETATGSDHNDGDHESESATTTNGESNWGDPTIDHDVMCATPGESDVWSSETNTQEDTSHEGSPPTADQDDQQQRLPVDSEIESELEAESQSPLVSDPDSQQQGDEEVSTAGSHSDTSEDLTALSENDVGDSTHNTEPKSEAAVTTDIGGIATAADDPVERVTAVQTSVTTLRKALASPMYADVKHEQSPELLVATLWTIERELEQLASSLE